MTKQVFYKYLGTNGVLETPIHLEDIYYVRMIMLQADKDMALTNGVKTVRSIKVPEEEVENWREIPMVNID